MNVAVVDTQSGERLAQGSLPLRVTFPPIEVGQPDNGVAIFSSIGQAEPAHDPRYKCVAQIVVTPEPPFPYLVTGETNAFVDDQDQVSRTYAPDRSAYEKAIEDLIERVGRKKGYASADRLAGYALDPAYSADAITFINWRSEVWVYTLSELEKVQSGQREIPTLDGFLSELPDFPWPM